MGLTNITKETPTRVKDQRDLTMEFNDGTLNIVSASKANARVAFMVNAREFSVTFDAQGTAQLVFEKSVPFVLYSVKIKDKTGLTDDQRLAFFY